MNDRYHPWLAALLALVIAGLGHAYLRRWGRAALWFGMILGGGALLTILYGETGSTVAETLPRQVLYPVVILFVASAADAFLVARTQLKETQTDGVSRDNPMDTPRGHASSDHVTDSEGRSAGGDGEPDESSETIDCPHCGKETDADIHFCHWCAEPLPGADE